MSLDVMTPYHAKWSDFIDALHGPDGCNFHEKVPGDRKTVTWKCNSGIERPITRRILEKMGATQQEIEQSLGFFMAHGGMCDCEVCFNVYQSVNPRRPVRRKNRKNPR